MKITTYKELEEYIRMFKKQNCDLLIIKSRAGLGKTTTLKKVMKGEDYVYICTHSTPLQTYKLLYEKIDCPVVFDDLDAILSNKVFVSLLKSISDTSPIKELHYNTTSRLIEDVPSSFKTVSNACILLNEFSARSTALEPILSRGFFIEFEPSRDEILKKIKNMCQNIAPNQKCVLYFIEEHYKKIDVFSLRTYTKALQLFIDDEKNWKRKFMAMTGFDPRIAEYMLLQEKYKTDKERIKKFGWSRRTYFRVKQEVGE